MDAEWLASLKAGDEVVVSGPFGRLVVETVERTTKTQIHVKGMGYFRRKDGVSPGAVGGCLKPANKTWREMVRQRELAKFIHANIHRMFDLPLSTLESIVAAMKDSADE